LHELIVSVLVFPHLFDQRRADRVQVLTAEARIQFLGDLPEVLGRWCVVYFDPPVLDEAVL
jgi:hypothetical protein